MQIQLTVGLLSILLCGQIAQITRWLWVSNVLPPMVIGIGLLIVLLALIALWLQWCKYLQTDSYSLFETNQFERYYPIALGLLGIVLGLI